MSIYPAPFLTDIGPVPDYMGDLRTWLRTHPYLTSLAARVFFHIPTSPAFPLVRLSDAGTTRQPGEAPIYDVALGVEIWGGKPADYAAVVNTERAVIAAFEYLAAGTLIGATVVNNVEIGTGLDSPDPDTGAPRKVLTPTLTVRALTQTG